ncbi:MAG: hypothetical protein JNJ85_15835, partial [Candidatus Kapabacteria bacterium]|nr:hypothetical protein [Candidatus Kapabacteria bacterium]
MKLFLWFTFFCIMLLFPTGKLYTQNLVPNPGFEDRVNNELPRPLINPDNANGLSLITRRNRTNDPKIVQNWFRGTQATPDYFHQLAVPPGNPNDTNQRKYGVLIPHNLSGSQTTVDSSLAYAGFLVNRPASNGTFEYREYLAVKLISPVKDNKTYQLTFQYSTGEFPGSGYERASRDTTPYSLARLGALCLPESTLDYYQDSLYYYNEPSFPNQNYLSTSSTNTRHLPITPSAEVRENNGYYSQDGWKEFKDT